MSDLRADGRTPEQLPALAPIHVGTGDELVPPEGGSAWLHTRDGPPTVPTEVDPCGCFVIGVRPDEPFRLNCRTETVQLGNGVV